MLLRKNKKYKKLNKKRKQSKPEKTYDLGLLILRPIFAYIVVMTHCYNYSYLPIRWKFICKKNRKIFFSSKSIFYYVNLFFI